MSTNDDYGVTTPPELGPGLEAYVPLKGIMVAEPPPSDPPVMMMEALPARVAELYSDMSKMLRSGEEAQEEMRGLNRQYNRVLGSRKEYRAYFARPDVRPLWDLIPEEEALGHCSFATVPKRNSEDQRKILMVVPFNTLAVAVSVLLGCEPEYGMQGQARSASSMPRTTGPR